MCQEPPSLGDGLMNRKHGRITMTEMYHMVYMGLYGSISWYRLHCIRRLGHLRYTRDFTRQMRVWTRFRINCSSETSGRRFSYNRSSQQTSTRRKQCSKRWPNWA